MQTINYTITIKTGRDRHEYKTVRAYNQKDADMLGRIMCDRAARYGWVFVKAEPQKRSA